MEIERKFLLKHLPNITPMKHIEVFQGYISTDPEVRIRSSRVLDGEDKGRIDYKLTIKGNGDLSRQEVETNISEEFFNACVNFIGLHMIHKDYRRYAYNGRILECSVVDAGTADSFYYGEVEFSSEEDAVAFEWPFADAVDVTYDKQYKMKNYWLRTRTKDCRAVHDDL